MNLKSECLEKPNRPAQVARSAATVINLARLTVRYAGARYVGKPVSRPIGPGQP